MAVVAVLLAHPISQAADLPGPCGVETADVNLWRKQLQGETRPSDGGGLGAALQLLLVRSRVGAPGSKLLG